MSKVARKQEEAKKMLAKQESCLCTSCPLYPKCLEMSKKLRPLIKGQGEIPLLAVFLAFMGGVAFERIRKDLKRLLK